MSDLTRGQVRILAEAQGLVVLPEDLPEVTDRLNAFLDAMASFEGLPKHMLQPTAALPHPELLP